MWDSIGCLIEWTDWVQTSLNLTRITVALALLFGLAAAVSAVWPLVVDEWRKGRDRVAKAVFVAAALTGVLYGGSKRATVSYPQTEAGRAYLVDRGSYVTNDYVHIDFERRIVPDDAALVVERREVASTNDTDWAEVVRTTFAAFAVPTNLPCANATNWCWIVYADWTPPPSVHTNGILEVKWGTSRKDAALRARGLAVGIPAQTGIALGGGRLAVPDARVYTARDYVQDGLICFYDESDPDGEVCDESYVLKPEGLDVYENPYTAEFVVAKETADGFEGIKWNTSSYPFILRPNGSGGYCPNAYLSGARSPTSYPLYQLPIGERHSIVVTANGEGLRQCYFDGKTLGSFVQDVGSPFVRKGSASPMKIKLAVRTGYPQSYRLYRRALTDEEVAHNYRVDCARFGLGAPSSAANAAALEAATAAPFASAALDALTGAAPALGEAVQTEDPDSQEKGTEE